MGTVGFEPTTTTYLDAPVNDAHFSVVLSQVELRSLWKPG